MIYRYEVKNNGKEDVLYLFLTLKTEFSKELAHNADQKEITRRTKNFIINNNIDFKGHKVYLIIDGIIVKTVDIRNSEFDSKKSVSYSNEAFLVNVKLDDKAIIEVRLKDYLLGVIASLYNNEIQYETLKCLSVLFRTYAYKMMQDNSYVLNNNDLFHFDDISCYRLMWSDKYELIVNKISEAIDDTDCLFLTYRNKFILPFIHVYNNGRTYSHNEYSYLSSVSSLWDLSNKNNKEVLDFSYNKISELLNSKINENSKIEVIKVGNDNSIMTLKIDDKVFSGEELKKLLSLRSLNLNIIQYKNLIRIITFGFGNSLGLSIYGSNELAKDGHDFTNILKYYFPKVKINKYIKELSKF